MRPSLLDARAIVAMSAIFWRSVWKYGARAYRYCFWDAGTILANLIAAANAEELASEVITAFEDAPLEVLIGADGEREGMVCLRRSDEPRRPVSGYPIQRRLLSRRLRCPRARLARRTW